MSLSQDMHITLPVLTRFGLQELNVNFCVRVFEHVTHPLVYNIDTMCLMAVA
jgi:hypothetical protein